ncbi:MAG: hypothetical protein ABI432_05865 [Flavobacteriales bacterium]
MNWTYDQSRDPLNNEFCGRLENAFNSVLNASEIPELKGFWCDGVLPPEEPPHSGWEVTDKHLVIYTKVYMGRSGQDLYECFLFFGPKSSALYLAGEGMDHVIPSPESEDWCWVDSLKRYVEARFP